MQESKSLLKSFYENVLLPYDEAKSRGELQPNVSFKVADLMEQLHKEEVHQSNPEATTTGDVDDSNAEPDNAADIAGPSTARKVSTTLSDSKKNRLLVKLDTYCFSSQRPDDE